MPHQTIIKPDGMEWPQPLCPVHSTDPARGHPSPPCAKPAQTGSKQEVRHPCQATHRWLESRLFGALIGNIDASALLNPRRQSGRRRRIGGAPVLIFFPFAHHKGTACGQQVASGKAVLNDVRVRRDTYPTPPATPVPKTDLRQSCIQVSVRPCAAERRTVS